MKVMERLMMNVILLVATVVFILAIVIIKFHQLHYAGRDLIATLYEFFVRDPIGQITFVFIVFLIIFVVSEILLKAEHI